MQLGKVIGHVVCTRKVESLEGLKLLLIQPLDENGSEKGTPIAACDSLQAGVGDVVLFEGGREAALAAQNWFNPSDAAVLAIVDDTEVRKQV